VPNCAESTEPMGRSLRLLVVCTGNICRTPMAVYFLTTAATEAGLDVVVTSSGFLTVDQPASPMVQEVMGERGADLSTHRSRLTTPEMLAQADLVITMERRHARDLVLMEPGSSRRIHTFGGAVALLEALPEDHPHPAEKLEWIGDARSAADLLGIGDDEVADPYGRSRKVNRQTADRLQDLSSRLIGALLSGRGS